MDTRLAKPVARQPSASSTISIEAKLSYAAICQSSHRATPTSSPAQLAENKSPTSLEQDEDEAVISIPSSHRRLDSLAWLIQSDDICGAACFSGSTLYLATNNNEEPAFYKIIISYLKDTAEASLSLHHELKNADAKNVNEKMTDFLTDRLYSIANVISHAMQHIELIKNDLYAKSFIRSLFKITFSTIASYLTAAFFTYAELPEDDPAKCHIKKINAKCLADLLQNIEPLAPAPKTIVAIKEMFSDIEDWIGPYSDEDREQRLLSSNLMRSLERLQKTIYLADQNSTSRKSLHAELRIVEQLLYDFKLLDAKGNINSANIPRLNAIYIGVSKRCCKNCACAIKAVNHVLKKYGMREDFIRLRSKKSSNICFPAKPPQFLHQSPELEAAFLRFRHANSIREAFNEKPHTVTAAAQHQRGSKKRSRKTHRHCTETDSARFFQRRHHRPRHSTNITYHPAGGAYRF